MSENKTVSSVIWSAYLYLFHLDKEEVVIVGPDISDCNVHILWPSD